MREKWKHAPLRMPTLGKGVSSSIHAARGRDHENTAEGKKIKNLKPAADTKPPTQGSQEASILMEKTQLSCAKDKESSVIHRRKKGLL